MDKKRFLLPLMAFHLEFHMSHRETAYSHQLQQTDQQDRFYKQNLHFQEEWRPQDHDVP